MTKVLVIPKIQAQKANAHSSSISVGFPALTGFYGFVHALERQLKQRSIAVSMPKFGVGVNEIEVHRHRSDQDRVFSLKDKGKPLKSDGGRQSTLEVASCDLTATIVIQINHSGDDELLIQHAQELLHSKLKLCGGDIITFHKPWVFDVDSDDAFKWLKRTLMPAQFIISRHDLMKDYCAQHNDALDAILDLTATHHVAEKELSDGEWLWKSSRKEKGWIVPIGVGFYAISDIINPNQILYARNTSIPHRFCESLIGLGEFKLSYRLKSLTEMLWSASYNDKLYVLK